MATDLFSVRFAGVFRKGEFVDPEHVPVQWLTGQKVRSMLIPPVFGRLSDSEIAFREKALAFWLINYTPVMHGLIRLDPTSRRVVVTGYANRFAAVLFVTLVLSGLMLGQGRPDLRVAVCGICLLGALYGKQFTRFRGVARFIKQHYIA